MPFPFQEALSYFDHLLAAGFSFLFALAGACVCGGSVFAQLAESRASGSMDPRWNDLVLRCAKTTRALAAWAVCPLGLGLWVVMMAQRPRMMEQLHSIFLAPALLGLLVFFLGLCCSYRYVSSWRRDSHESRLRFAWGLLSAICFWCAAAVLVSICAFSIHTGAWIADPVLMNVFWNPAFPAMFVAWAGVSTSAFAALGLLYAAARRDGAWRAALAYELGKWMLAASVIGVVGWACWGISLPEEANRKPALWWLASSVAAQVALGGIAYRWGVRESGKRGRIHAGAASILVVFLMAACGWVYVEAKGNFQIHRYMYRNGMIIEEAEAANQTSLWSFVNLGAPLPAQEELGAFGFRAQCMACHADWVEPKNPARSPGFSFEGDALRFLGEIHAEHPAYPLLMGASEERHALAAYLEETIAKSGRTLASRPKPPQASRKTEARPAVVSKTPPRDGEKPFEASGVSRSEPEDKSVAAPAFASPAVAPDAEKTQEAKAPERENLPAGSSAPPVAAQEQKKSQEQEQTTPDVTSTRSSGAQDVKISKPAGAISIAPTASPAASQSVDKPEEAGGAPPVSPGPPDDAQDAGNARETRIPPENESAVTPPAFSDNEQDVTAERSRQTEGLEGEGGNLGVSLVSPNNAPDAEKPQDAKIPEQQENAAVSPPAPSSAARDAKNPEGGESVPAAPSVSPDDPQDAKKPEEKSSP